MKILVTGGSGFLGRYVMRELMNRNIEVNAIHRGDNKNLSKQFNKVNFIKKEISEISQHDFEGIFGVIHLASAGVSPKKASIKDLLEVNIKSSADILNFGSLANVKRFIYAGTCHEYGLSANDYDFIPTNAPLKPQTLYGASKASGFYVSNIIAKEKNLELVYARIFSAYGEGQNINNFWPSLKKAALSGKDFFMTSGKQIRDLIPVEKVASALVDNLKRNDVSPGKPLIVNIGSGKEVSLAEFAKKEWNRLEAKGKLNIGALKDRGNEPSRFVPKLEQ